MRAWIFRRRPFPARDVPGGRAGCAEHAARVRARKDAGLQMLCLSLSYVEREKGKKAAVRSRQVTRGYGLSQFAISAAGPVGFAGRWLHVKKKIWLAASQLRFTATRRLAACLIWRVFDGQPRVIVAYASDLV